MSEDVKPRRRYDSSRRQAQAAQTRQDVLAAAREAFLEHGYTGTTLAAIAKAAGVVVETIYRGFGGKAGLFKAVVEAAVAGGTARAEVPVDERPAVRALIDEPDPRRQLERYAATQPGIHHRMGPLMRVLATAAATDSELARVQREMDDFRLAGLGRFAQLLADRGALRPGLSVEQARDILWTLASHATYDQLVTQRGWSTEDYQTWLAETLCRTLL
ncbi:TetR/AcrR family transcriptional regulator [Phytohabitans sp. LJ34]|uniref:TetR/AcrR family transcriptional regulator n=1 Tax=Phytohabitans sp. LJ34 TaxID=3452217 RepID=UPI003F8ABE60